MLIIYTSSRRTHILIEIVLEICRTKSIQETHYSVIFVIFNSNIQNKKHVVQTCQKIKVFMN